MRLPVAILLALALLGVCLWSLRWAPSSALPPEPTTIAPAAASAGPSPSMAFEAPAPAPAAPAGASDSDGRVVPAQAAPSANVEPAALTALSVVDDAGAPLAGASVRASVDETLHEASTDADGHCVIPTPGRDGSLHLFVEKEGYFHRKAYYKRLSELTISLPRLTILRGRVLDAADGTPVPGASVALTHGYCKRCEPEYVPCARDGSFVLEGAPTGERFAAHARAEGYAVEGADFTFEDPAATNEGTVWLRRTARARGVVVDAEDGRRIPDAEVQRVGPVQPDGSFELNAVPHNGRVDVRAGAPGYCETRGELLVNDKVQELPLLRGALVGGTLLTPSGEGVAGATLSFRRDYAREAVRAEGLTDLARLLPPGWSMTEARYQVTTADSTGRFESPALLPYCMYRLLTGEEGYERVDIELPALGGPGSHTALDVELVCMPLSLASWKGYMLLNGEPIAGGLRWEQGEASGYATVEKDGRFALEDLPAGQLRIKPSPRDRARGDFSRLSSDFERTLEIAAGQSLERDLNLELDTRPIAGQVRTESGNAVEDAYVRAWSQDPRFRVGSWTNSAGHFSFEVPGAVPNLRVSVRQGQQSVLLDNVAPGTEDLVIVVPETGVLRVKVDQPGPGAPLEYWCLWWRSAGSDDFETVRRGHYPDLVNGWLEVPFATGSFELVARRVKGGPLARLHTTLLAGQTRDVHLELPGGTPLELVLPEGGAVPAGARLGLVEEGEAQALAALLASGRPPKPSPSFEPPPAACPSAEGLRFDQRGRARLPVVAAGRYRLLASPGFVVEPTVLVLQAGERASVEVCVLVSE